VNQQQQQHDEQEDQALAQDLAGNSAGDGAAGGFVRSAAASAAAGSVERQLLGAMIVLSRWASALPWGYMSALEREALLQLALPLAELAQAAGEADYHQVQRLWETFNEAGKPLAAGVVQLALDVQLQLQACAVVGLPPLSDDTEACNMVMQLLLPMKQLASAVAGIQTVSVAVRCGTGWQPGALSLRMASDCNEIHAVLTGYTEGLLQLGTSAMPLPEAQQRMQACSWWELATAASELEPAANWCLQLLDDLAYMKSTLLNKVICLTAAATRLA
jgi:hypothetical protein